MKIILAWFAKLFSTGFYNPASKIRPTQKERDIIVELSRHVDMDEHSGWHDTSHITESNSKEHNKSNEQSKPLDMEDTKIG